MELGNLIYGNSRGEFPVPRDWTDAFLELTYIIAEKYYNTEMGILPFDCEIFTILPYQWNCDCTEEHISTCSCLKPNFLYKPTRFEIKLYKYPMRDSYMNQKITKSEFQTIVAHCISMC